MTEDQKAKFKFACKKRNGYSMNMDGTIRNADHAAVVVAALDGQYPDNHNLLNASSELLEAAKRLEAEFGLAMSKKTMDAVHFARAAIAKAEGRV